jgi:hypothetical protein
MKLARASIFVTPLSHSYFFLWYPAGTQCISREKSGSWLFLCCVKPWMGALPKFRAPHLGVSYFCNMPVMGLYPTLKLKLESAMDRLCRSWGHQLQCYWLSSLINNSLLLQESKHWQSETLYTSKLTLLVAMASYTTRVFQAFWKYCFWMHTCYSPVTIVSMWQISKYPTRQRLFIFAPWAKRTSGFFIV